MAITSAAVARFIKQLEQELLSPEFTHGPYYSILQYRRFAKCAAAAQLSVRGARCIDLGCGPNKPFATASLLYLMGAREVLAIDVQPYANPGEVSLRLYALLLCVALDVTDVTKGNSADRQLVFSRLGDFDLNALKAGELRAGLPSAIRHVVGDYTALTPGDAAFDVCVSFSVFEHISDLQSLLSCLLERMSENGAVFADIDYRDHRLYAKKLSPWQYLIDNEDYSPGYINKLRHSLMTKAIQAAGFDVQVSEMVRARPPGDVLARLHPDHRHWGMDDLSIVEEKVILRRSSHEHG
jgi:SAM-dependent methyltransferase